MHWLFLLIHECDHFPVDLNLIFTKDMKTCFTLLLITYNWVLWGFMQCSWIDTYFCWCLQVQNAAEYTKYCLDNGDYLFSVPAVLQISPCAGIVTRQVNKLLRLFLLHRTLLPLCNWKWNKFPFYLRWLWILKMS